MLSTIKALCKERGITMQELRERANIPPGTMYRWDENRPSVDKAKAVADALGCTVDDLLKEDGADAKRT